MPMKRKQVIVVDEGSQHTNPYFQWTEALNALLIQCMVELVQGHQVENGSFKNGTFSKLESMMEQRAPGCGVKVEPNIRSRHKKLKKDFHVVHLIRSQSGCGWNDVTKTPTLDDDVFTDFIMVHPNCKNLNRKPFPYYDELLKVFGKTGPANGRKTVGLTDNVASTFLDGANFVDLDGIKTPIEVEVPSAEMLMEDIINEGVENSQRVATTPPTQTIVNKAKKVENKTDDTISAVAQELCGLKPVISKAHDALGNILEDRNEESGKEAVLMAEIGKITGLDRGQVLDAAMALVENERKTRLFYALNNGEDRKYFIHNLLR